MVNSAMSRTKYFANTTQSKLRLVAFTLLNGLSRALIGVTVPLKHRIISIVQRICVLFSLASSAQLNEFELFIKRLQVTKEKTWKNLCPEANPEMAESSAAGYQLRRHYQKILLNLECSETGQNANELIAFAEKQKKSKKKKTPEQADTSFSSPGAD